MSDSTQFEVSIGAIFESLEEVQKITLEVAKKSTEMFEVKTAQQAHDLSLVVADVLYLLQEHLSCHDCKVVDHTHEQAGGEVQRVYDGVVERIDE